MLQLYSQLNQELFTIGGSSNNIIFKIYSSNDPISNAYLIGQSNHALYITTLCNLPTYVGIGTNTPTASLHVSGNTILSSSLTVGIITTQNNIINAGSGTIYGNFSLANITTGSITTQNNIINADSGIIYGTIFGNGITSGTITSQNNIINAGSGIIYASNIYIAGNIYNSSGVPYSTGGGGGSFTSGQAITTATITTQNNIINAGSGTIYTSYLGAFNVSQILTNITKHTYIDSVTISRSSTNVTLTIVGNSSSYTYNVYIDSNLTPIATQTTSALSYSFLYTFSSGSHTISAIVDTISSGGIGTGSSATNTFTFNV
jgi:hypothetical protein